MPNDSRTPTEPVRDLFNDISAQYADLYGSATDFSVFPSAEVRLTKAKKLVTNHLDSGILLDLGCGFGLAVQQFQRLGFEVHGIDIAENMIVEAKQRMQLDPRLDLSMITLEVGDAEDLQFSDCSVDVVIALGLLDYLNGDSRVFGEIKRVLRPNGIAIVAFRNRLFNLFSLNKQSVEHLISTGDLDVLLGEVSSELSSETDDYLLEAYAKQITDILPDQIVSSSRRSIETMIQNRRNISLRQHTPNQVRQLAKSEGFFCNDLLYFHFHPFPPHVEQSSPQIFNKIALNMEIFDRSPIGALMASGFVTSLLPR